MLAMTVFTSSLRGVRRGNLLVKLRLPRCARNDGFYFVIARRYDVAICYLERDCFPMLAMTVFTFVFARRYDVAICYLERDCFPMLAMTVFTFVFARRYD